MIVFNLLLNQDFKFVIDILEDTLKNLADIMKIQLKFIKSNFLNSKNVFNLKRSVVKSSVNSMWHLQFNHTHIFSIQNYHLDGHKFKSFTTFNGITYFKNNETNKCHDMIKNESTINKLKQSPNPLWQYFFVHVRCKNGWLSNGPRDTTLTL